MYRCSLIICNQVNIAAGGLRVLPMHSAAAAGSAKSLELLLQVACDCRLERPQRFT
jgi:hypothetical protein